MIREVRFNVLSGAKGITPENRAWGGMQYEDNATTVLFDISSLGDINALYRIDFNSPVAGYMAGNNIIPQDGILRRALPEYVTRYGADTQVVAVITLLSDDGEPTGVCYTYPAELYFTAVEKDAVGEAQTADNISEMEKSVAEMLESAQNAEQTALALAEQTAETARTSAELLSAATDYVDSTVAGVTSFDIDSNGGEGYLSLAALQAAHPVGQKGVFYLVKNDNPSPNVFEEYFWQEGEVGQYILAGAFGGASALDFVVNSSQLDTDKIVLGDGRNNIKDSGVSINSLATVESVNAINNSRVDALPASAANDSSLYPSIRLLKDLLLAQHPVGSIYMSMDSTEPSVLFGGTWQRIKDTFLLAAGDSYPPYAEGGVQANNSTLPFLAVFVWQRTA